MSPPRRKFASANVFRDRNGTARGILRIDGRSRAEFEEDAIIPKSGHWPDIKRPHYDLGLKIQINSTLGIMAMTTLIESIGDAPFEPSSVATITRYASNICVGRRLRAGRTSSGISHGELCGRLGIDRYDLSAYEQGAKRVSANLLLRLAQLLEVPPDYFFQGYSAEELSACLESFPLNINSRVPGH